MWNNVNPVFRTLVGIGVMAVGILLILSSAAFSDLGGKIVLLIMALGAFVTFSGTFILTSWDDK